jgi:glycosyltransferase involved in cell wall biosynthesis
MLNRWADLALQLVALRLRGAVTRHRPRIGAYCIGYSDPVDELAARRVPPAVGRLVSRLVLRLLVLGMDRLAFGTQGSRALLERYAGRRRVQSRGVDFTAVPAACACLVEHEAPRDPDAVLFVGAFDERKGVRQTMAAWELVHERAPALRLRLIGKGRLTDDVLSWAEDRAEVDVLVDPPRVEIHRALRESHVLVLLSQRVGAWREQVGLPIVEGLAHGCEVVTTDETGIAGWLQQHGHTVVPMENSSAAQTSRAIASAAACQRSAAEVIAHLPSVDTRAAADRWLLQADDGEPAL